jgi:hypothetical protein
VSHLGVVVNATLVETASNFLPSTVTVDRQREAIIFLLKYVDY